MASLNDNGTSNMMVVPPNLTKSFRLNDGYEVPVIGFGTFQGDSGNAKVKELVLEALKQGYRHIDCATAYGNEKEVGEAIKESGIPRHELFITTKLAQTWHEPEDVEEALDQSLKALQLDYIDLYLMHFPHAYKAGPNHSTLRPDNGKPVIDYALSRRYTDTYQAMEKLVDSGKARSIGVSKFIILKLKRVLEIARIKPAVNQVELHPYLPQPDLSEFCKEHDIHLMAHQPLGGAPVGVVAPNAHIPGPRLDSEIAQIAQETNTTPAQVLLAWAVQRGTSVIPRTARVHRLKENLTLMPLSREHFGVVNSLTDRRGTTRYLVPTAHIGFDIFDEEVDQPVDD